jgi:protocatechuate 3,4-dioxygenase beta subunit
MTDGRRRNSWILLGALALAGATALWLFELERSPSRSPAEPVARPSPTPRDVEPASLPLPNPDRGAGTDRAKGPDTPRAASLPADPAARAIRGEVHDSFGAPIAGAEIAVAIVEPTESHDAGSARSDAAGRFELSAQAVDDLEPARRGVAELVAVARAAGYQSQKQEIHLRALSFEPATPLKFTFTLKTGNTLTGRVVDRQGAPVRDAEVELIANSGKNDADEKPAPGSTRNVCSRDSTGSDGRFVLSFVSRGRYRLAAREPHTGTAFRDKLELAADHDQVVDDVVLRGDGVLAGTARYSSGVPAAALELWAIPDWLAKEPNALAATSLQAPDQERDEGLFYGRATTDAAGRFRFAGLRTSNYALRSPRDEIVLEPHQLTYVLGNENIALDVQTYRMLVRVKDATGRPLTGANVACAAMTQSQDGHLETGKVDHSQAAGSEAIASFEVEAEHTYALTATSPGCLAAEDLAILAPGEYEHRHDLVLQPAGAKGRLHITLEGAPNASPSTLEVAFYSALTEQRCESIGVLSPDANGWLPPLPPGRYRLQVGFGASEGELSLYFPIQAREEVEVRPSSTTETTVRARLGARVRLALDVGDASTPTPTAAISEKQRERALRERGAAVTVACGASGANRSVQFVRPAAEQPKRFVLESLLEPGEAAVIADLLEPGECTLHIEAPGFQSAEQRVHLPAGTIMDVRIALIRK